MGLKLPSPDNSAWKVADLPRRDPQRPVRIDTLAGSVSGVRPIELTREDAINFGIIDRELSEDSPDEFGQPFTEPELIQDIIDSGSYRQDRPEDPLDLTYGVSGFHNVDGKEQNELQGWLYFYQDNYAEQILKTGLLPEGITKSQLYAVTYKKKNEAASHQISSALRYSLTKISAKDKVRHAKRIVKEEEKFLASISRLPMEEKLQALKEHDEKVRADWKPQPCIMAYVKPGNEASIGMLESNGFRYLGDTDLKFKRKTRTKKVYMLDWDNFHENMYQRTDPEILKKVQPKPATTA